MKDFSVVILQMQGVIQVTAVSFCDGGQWKPYDPTCFANQPLSQQITEEVVIDPTGRQLPKGTRMHAAHVKERFAFLSPCSVSTQLGLRLTSSYPTLKERNTLLYFFSRTALIPPCSLSPRASVSLLHHDIKAKVKASVSVAAIKFQALENTSKTPNAGFFFFKRGTTEVECKSAGKSGGGRWEDPDGNATVAPRQSVNRWMNGSLSGVLERIERGSRKPATTIRQRKHSGPFCILMERRWFSY